MATLAAKLRLDVVTPLGTAWAGEADEVRLPSVLGEMGVLPGHRPLLAAVRAGVVLVRRAETVERLAVGRRFAEVGAAKVVLLVDRCAEGNLEVGLGVSATEPLREVDPVAGLPAVSGIVVLENGSTLTMPCGGSERTTTVAGSTSRRRSSVARSPGR